MNNAEWEAKRWEEIKESAYSIKKHLEVAVILKNEVYKIFHKKDNPRYLNHHIEANNYLSYSDEELHAEVKRSKEVYNKALNSYGELLIKTHML